MSHCLHLDDVGVKGRVPDEHSACVVEPKARRCERRRGHRIYVVRREWTDITHYNSIDFKNIIKLVR